MAVFGRVMTVVAAVALLLLPSRGLAQQSAHETSDTTPGIQPAPEHPYLKPCTPAVGGVHHLALIYAGGKSRIPWDAQKLLPYVAYVDRQGKPQDWLFDSFLWIEFATNDGSYLHFPLKGKRPVTKQDWQWLLDRFFDPAHGVGQLQASVSLAAKTLGEPRQVSLILTMPTPYAETSDFGALETGGRSLNFARDEDRLAALQWYIRSALERWKQINAPQVRLAGVYWLLESIGPKDAELAQSTARFVHSLGLKLYWIPYYGAPGLKQWRELGMDAVALQPNYFFNAQTPPERLAMAAHKAEKANAGMELELDGRAIETPGFDQRYLAYLDAGVKYGFMRDTFLAYYEGGGALAKCANADKSAARGLYDHTYEFVQGRYRPSGTTQLPDLGQLSHSKPGNLALASQGARISGKFHPGPGLAPEQLIDGQESDFGGSSGFAAFGWPGSFTLELSQPHVISQIDTLLWNLDKRTFRYRIEVSEDGQRWTQVVDKSAVECGGWQDDRFPPTRARYIRFTGLHSTANSLFQIVKIEVYP